MNQEKRKRFISFQNLLMLTLACIINAAGVVLFLSPVKLYDGGISGTSMLLAHVTPESMPISLFLLLNMPMVTGSRALPLHSILAYMAALKAVDYIVESFDRSKCAIIVTSRPDEICYALSRALESGMTRVDGRGAFPIPITQ